METHCCEVTAIHNNIIIISHLSNFRFLNEIIIKIVLKWMIYNCLNNNPSTAIIYCTHIKQILEEGVRQVSQIQANLESSMKTR